MDELYEKLIKLLQSQPAKDMGITDVVQDGDQIGLEDNGVLYLITVDED